MTASDNAGQMSGVAIYRRLLGYALAYWQTFALGILCMVVLAASQPLVPALLKPLLDGSFVDRDLTLVGQTTFALVGAFLVRGIAAYLSALTMAWVAGKVVMDLRAEMFERLMSMPISDADSTSSGRLISKVTFDAQQVTDASTRAVMVLVSDSLTVVALLAWMAYLDWMLTLLTLATAPVRWERSPTSCARSWMAIMSFAYSMVRIMSANALARQSTGHDAISSSLPRQPMQRDPSLSSSYPSHSPS
jgi:subfamily B ATP-binding cassette protein MsbA